MFLWRSDSNFMDDQPETTSTRRRCLDAECVPIIHSVTAGFKMLFNKHPTLDTSVHDAFMA